MSWLDDNGSATNRSKDASTAATSISVFCGGNVTQLPSHDKAQSHGNAGASPSAGRLWFSAGGL
jgi:hypothetical protein